MTDPSGTPAQSPRQKFLIEWGPLLVFFLINYLEGIFAATGAFMAAMAAAMAYSWHLSRHIAPMLWVSGGLVLVFGGLTLALQDELFIKIKPTLVYLIFAAVLGAGLAFGRIYLRMVLGAAFPPLTERGWRILTLNWTIFFIVMAAANEVVWRSFSTDIWVAFKTFGAIPITFLFAIAQAPVILKNQAPEQAAEKPAQ